MKHLRAALGVAVLILAAASARADNWPQWRGPANDGVSKEANLPAELGPDKNLLWKFKMPGTGGSTPAVWGDRLFATSEEGKDLVVLCVSTAGKELWKRRLGSATRAARGDEGNGASASPSTDGKHVWAFVGSGELACYDFDGNEVWKVNTQERYGAFRIQFGMHSTPVLDGGRLYLQLIHDGGGHVVALDAATGKEVWNVLRPSDGRAECLHSYASAMMWRKGGDALLLAHGNDYCTAHRLADGKEVWRVGGLNPKDKYETTLRFVASPLATPDLIVVPSAKQKGVVALRPTAEGLVVPGNPAEVWRLASGTPDVPSPLLHDGLVYLCGQKGEGNLRVLDAQTGKELYYQPRLHEARHRASPVYADGKIYLTGRDGVVTVIKPGPTFERLATNKLGDQVSASPAVSNGRIYIRGFEYLYAFGAK